MIAIALPSETRAAGGAYVVDDAAVGKAGSCKIESWASFADDGDVNAVSNPACVFDLGKPVEIGVQFQRARSSGEWDTLLTPKAKVNLVPVETGKIGVALTGELGLNATTGGLGISHINVPLTWTLRDDFKINVNGGWLYDGATKLPWLTWGGGFEWEFKKPFTFLAEVFGQVGHDVPEQTSMSWPRMQAGLRYTPKDNVDIDVIYGRNITGDNANWITVGLNLRFGD